MTRCLALPGAVGVIIHGYSDIDNDSSVQYPDQGNGIEAFWAAVEKSNKPLYLHTRTPPISQMDIYANGMGVLSGSVFGFTDYACLELLRLMLAGFFDRYPNLNIIVGHAAEGLPYTVNRMDQRLRHFTKSWAAQQTLQYYLEHNVIATLSGVQSQATFDNLYKVFGSDRIMASVDSPFEDVAEMMTAFDSLDINFKAKEMIAYGNAQSWFGISNLVTPTAASPAASPTSPVAPLRHLIRLLLLPGSSALETIIKTVTTTSMMAAVTVTVTSDFTKTATVTASQTCSAPPTTTSTGTVS